MKIKENYGQALVEILASFVLLTFLLSGLIVAGLFALRNTQYAKNRSTAAKMASEQLERVRVVRDINGIAALSGCANPCFVNPQLTMGAVATIEIYEQSLMVATPGLGECPLPTAGQAGSTIYKVTARTRWNYDPAATPGKQVVVDTCLSDWK